MNKSWKTSSAALFAVVAAIAGIAKQLLDADASTNPDWAIQMPLILAALQGFFARDNDKTSEQVGATTKP